LENKLLKGSFLITLLWLTSMVSLAQVQESETIGDWQLNVSKDPLTDQISIRAVSHEVNGEQGVSLGLGCTGSDEFAFLYIIGGYMEGIDKIIEGRYRVDDKSPSAMFLMALIRDTTTMIIDQDAIALATAMLGAEKLLFRITDPSDGEIRDHYFGLKGAGETFEKLGCVKI